MKFSFFKVQSKKFYLLKLLVIHYVALNGSCSNLIKIFMLIYVVFILFCFTAIKIQMEKRSDEFFSPFTDYFLLLLWKSCTNVMYAFFFGRSWFTFQNFLPALQIIFPNNQKLFFQRTYLFLKANFRCRIWMVLQRPTNADSKCQSDLPEVMWK